MKPLPDFSRLEALKLTLQPRDIVIVKAPGVKFMSKASIKVATAVAKWLQADGHHPLVACIPSDWTVEKIPEDVMARYGWFRRKAEAP